MWAGHVIWDWNGTLLDDLSVVIESLNVGLGKFGLGLIDEDEYRDHFTRPVRDFYDSLFGRLISDLEWQTLNDTFHDEYFRRVSHAELRHDALEALARVDEMSWTQSLLSMTTHEKLVEIVGARGIYERFTAVDGLREETGGHKARHLTEHITLLAMSPDDSVVIGDTPDDAVAAMQAGARAILYDGGSHHSPTLEAVGVPVARSLVEAVNLAAGQP
jgi:phosphoglycolate phosphatase-like HAD superfamily hydrolase